MKLPTSARVGIGTMVLLWGTPAHVRKAGNVSRMADGAPRTSFLPSTSVGDTDVLKFRTSVEKGRFRVSGLSFLSSLL